MRRCCAALFGLVCAALLRDADNLHLSPQRKTQRPRIASHERFLHDRPHRASHHRASHCRIVCRAKRAANADAATGHLFIANLAYDVSADGLRTRVLTAANAAQIFEVRVPVHQHTGRGRGFGFVALENEEAAERVLLALNGTFFRGRRISVRHNVKEDVRTAGPAAADVRTAGPVADEAPRKVVDATPAPAPSPAPASSAQPPFVQSRAGAVALNKLLVTASTEDVYKLFAAQSSVFNEVNLATAVYRLGQNLAKPDDPRLQRIVAATTTRIAKNGAKWQPRALANVAWALAKIKLRPNHAVFRAVASEASGRAAEFSAQELANTAWAFATADCLHIERKLSASLAREAALRIADFSEQGLANTAWAFATAARRQADDAVRDVFAHRDLFDAIARESTQRITSSKARSLANTARAFATTFSGTDRKTRLEYIACLEDDPRFESESEIAAALGGDPLRGGGASRERALASDREPLPRDQRRDPELFGALARAVAEKIDSYAEDEDTTIPFDEDLVEDYGLQVRKGPLLFEVLSRAAFATAQQPGDPFSNCEAFSTAATNSSPSSAAWAFATLAQRDPAMARAIAASITEPRSLKGFKAQELANSAWAFATVGLSAPPLFEAIAADVSSRISEFSAQGLSNMAWAFATNGCFDDSNAALRGAIATATPRIVRDFEPQHLANTAWAFATAGVVDKKLFEALAAEIFRRLGDFDQPEALAQLHQLELFLRVEAPSLSPLLPGLEPRLRSAFIATKAQPSRTQVEVSAALHRVGWTHDFEHVTADGLSLDMAQSATKHAVEFDGPNHYLFELPCDAPLKPSEFDGGDADTKQQLLNGNSRFKRRMLRRLGWKVVHVPYFEWSNLRTDTQQEEYLLRRLSELRDRNNYYAL